MATKIFVNLPVKNLGKSIEFFTKLGYTFNPQFTDDKAACMIIAEKIFAMLVVEEFFQTFTNKQISDATKSTESIIALSADSKAAVNDLADKALLAGGSKSKEPQDLGFMYSRSFNDLDGHLWEVMWMDMSKVPATPES